MNREVTPALESIQRYVIVGMIMFGCVTFGIGGWAATSQLSGAVVAQGIVVVDSKRQESPASNRWRRRRIART